MDTTQTNLSGEVLVRSNKCDVITHVSDEARHLGEMLHQSGVAIERLGREGAEHYSGLLAAINEKTCEVRDAVRVEADRTRMLVDQIDRQRLNQQLTDAKAEVNFLRARCGGAAPRVVVDA
jgi:L-rhamnose isomerase